MSQTFWEVDDPESMSIRRAIELLWGDAIMNLRATNGEVLVPRNIVRDLLGDNSLITLADRLANLMNKKVHIILDESRDCYRLLASNAGSVTTDGSSVTEVSVSVNDHSSISTAVGAAEDQVVQSARVPRPPNCFILYRQNHHHEVKDAYPGVSNNEISRILGARWNNESDVVRQRYTMLADILKRKHAIEHPNYQYTPRRPSERKRRATRVRSEDLTSAENEELLDNTQVTQNGDYSVSVDGNFMDMHDQDLFFGPNSVAPVSVPFNESDLQAIVHDQLSGASFGSMEYSATFTNCMDLDIPNREMHVSDLH